MSRETDMDNVFPFHTLQPTKESIEKLENHKLYLAQKENTSYNNLIRHILDLYPGYSSGDLFFWDLTTIDYYLGAVACEYETPNYDLSNRIFALNERLEDVEAFDLTIDDLKDIYNILNEVYCDITSQKLNSVDPYNSFNDIVAMLCDLVNSLIDVTTQEEFARSLKRLFALIDFFLYDDDQHTAAVNHLGHHKWEVSEYSRFTRACDEKIIEIKDKIKAQKVESPPIHHVQPIETTHRPHKKLGIMVRLKDFLSNTLGIAGFILYFVFSMFICVMPVLMFDLPWWAYTLICLLIIYVLVNIPGFTELSWIIGLVGAIKGKQDIFAIIYYIVCAIIVGTFIYRLIKMFIQERKYKE